MKKLLLGTFLLLVITPVFATTHSLIFKDEEINNSMNGPYVGALIGFAQGTYAMQQTTIADGYLSATSANAVNQAGNQHINTNGLETGIEAGYNWQMTNILFGLETDLQTIKLAGSKYSIPAPYPGAPGVTFNVGADANINWLYTLRPRLGLIKNNFLFYVTAGLALTRVHGNFYLDDTAGALISGYINSLTPGYTIGGGIEWALAKHVTLKVEYLYVKFNKINATANSSNILATFPGQQFKYSEQAKANLLRIGLNYKFA